MRYGIYRRLALLILCVGIVGGTRCFAAPEEGISTGRYVTGGILGSAIGFGIGHAVQERYLPLGLVFTLAEGATFAMAIADSSRDTTTDGYGLHSSRSFGTVGVIGLIAYCGLHVWEILDVWLVGNEYRQGHSRADSDEEIPASRLALLPVAASAAGSAPGMSMLLRF